MKILSSLAALAAVMVTTVVAQDCSTYQHTVTAEGMTPPLTLDYVADMENGIFRGQVTYQGQGWVGFGISPTGFMAGSQAVIGLAEGEPNAGVNRYLLDGYSPEQIVLMNENAPRNVEESLVQNDTHSVLTFAAPLTNNDDAYSIDTTGGLTQFIMAAGSTNELGYHAVRTPLELQVEPCEATANIMADDPVAEPIMADDPVLLYDLVVADDLAGLMVGDSIWHEGYVLDQFCINQGVFLDQPDLVSLENPDKHTVHCLIDAPPCIATPFELLLDPQEGETTWTRAFVLDPESKDQVVALAKTLGGPSCTECDGTGHLKAGFRVRVGGTVSAMADAATGVPATLSVTTLEPIFPWTGQAIELDGYISDQFCLDAGVFLDNGLPSLEMPDKHTIHCLIDPPVCIESPFEVLLEPEAGSTMYQRGYTLDDASKADAVALAKEVGVCDECDGTGTIVEGFQAMLDATIVNHERNLTSGSGPLIAVTDIEPIYPMSAPLPPMDMNSLMVNDVVWHEGYVLDQYCIEQGIFLDQPDLVSLENPDKHTVHCLIDAPPCIATPFELLLDPEDGETTWTRAFVLDDASKDQVVALAKTLGGPSCTECDGTGHLRAGFRVRVFGVVTRIANGATGVPATISLRLLEAVFPFTGQAIEVEGYISDQFCLDAGLFLDNGLPSLEMPDKHTVHCLIDPPVCVESPFEVLLEPEEGSTMYQRGYTLDDASKADAVALAKEVGVCDQCDGTGTIVEGFRAMLDATFVNHERNLTSGSGPLISVSSIEPVYPDVEYTIGQEIIIEGYVTDQFCIERGNFLDTGLPTLENVDRHTLHCLLDPPPCLETPFEIMMDPDYEAGETMWSRGFVLDDASKEQVIALGREIGNCDTCSGGEDGQLAGFRVRFTATIEELADPESGAGPLVSVTGDTLESVGQYSVDQTIQVEGYVIDTYCIERGTFLDTGLPTLANGDQHTVHCLIDAPPCIASVYEIVYDPIVDGGNWTRAFTLDQASKDQVVALGKEVGECSDCDGTGSLVKGLRFLFTATVVDNMWNATTGSGPLISIVEAEPVLPAEDDAGGGGEVDCSELQQTVEYPGTALTLEYVLLYDEETMEGNLSARVTYEGEGWVGFAVSPDGSMVGSEAIIGLPGNGVGVYDLNERAATGVVLADESRQSILLSSEIMQEDGVTVLTFTRSLSGEVPIVPNANNWFLTASGSSNELGFHNGRGAVEVSAVPCTAEGGGAADVSGATACELPPVSQTFSEVPITLTYELGIDEESGMGTFSAVVEYEGLGWVGFGISPDGRMGGSLAVIGLPDEELSESNPGKYDLGGYALEQVALAEQQTLLDANIEQNDTHTILSFTKFLTEPDEIAINPSGDNFFLVAAGTSNELAYHGPTRHPFTETLTCPGGAPVEDTEEEETEAPAGAVTTTGEDGMVNCSEFQVTYEYPSTALTLEYVLLYDEETMEGNLSARVTYDGEGWVGFAVSPDGSMVGSEAIIGLPADGTVGVYNLNAQSVSGVVLADETSQTIILSAEIVQEEGVTVLTFTRSLEGQVPIDPNGINWFLSASGIENTLGFHNGRGAVEVALAPCTAEGGGASAIIGGGSTDRKENHFKAHGWLACIAWGILVPIAIGNSLCRHLIPVQGLWFEVHRAFNALAIVMTIIAFAIVVNALEQTTTNPNHFKPIDGGGALGKHKTIGLVVFILAIIQGVGGVMRPHLPAKNDDGSDAEPKSAVRTMWEFAHKFSGVAILAMAWYQCHSGLKTYALIFNANDYTDVFWGVTGAISAIVVVGALTRFCMPAKPATHSPVAGDEIEAPATD